MVRGMIDRGELLDRRWGAHWVNIQFIYRDAFTKAFTPAIFYQSTKTDKLKPGDFRMHTEMRVHIELTGRSTIRMPTRESSKVSNRSRTSKTSLMITNLSGLGLRREW
jgi:hypothetical protein